MRCSRSSELISSDLGHVGTCCKEKGVTPERESVGEGCFVVMVSKESKCLEVKDSNSALIVSKKFWLLGLPDSRAG